MPPNPHPNPQPNPMPHPNPPSNFRPDYRRYFPQQYFVVNYPIQSTYAQNLANTICSVIYGYNVHYPNPTNDIKQVYNDYVNVVNNIIKAMGYTYVCSPLGSGAILTNVVIDHNQVASTVCMINAFLKKYPTAVNNQTINNGVLLTIKNQLQSDMISHGYTFDEVNCTATLSNPLLFGTYQVPTRYGSYVTYNYNRNGNLSGIRY